MKNCTIYLVRHGETDWNREGRWQGHTDIPLNDQGRAQAKMSKAVFSSLSFDAIYSSDLNRTRETAEIIGEGRSQAVECYSDFREVSCKPLEGKQFNDLPVEMREAIKKSRNLPAPHYFSHKWHPLVESQKECFQRVTQCLIRQISLAGASSLLVVTHGGIIRFILDHFHFEPGKTWKVQNCGYVQLSYSNSTFKFEQHHGIESISSEHV